MVRGLQWYLLASCTFVSVCQGRHHPAGLKHFTESTALSQESSFALPTLLPDWWSPKQSDWHTELPSLNASAVSHSQWAEDIYARDHFFSGKKGGTYLEIGALNGDLLSNTHYFREALGWRGVLIEGNPRLYEQLVQNRKRDICVNAAVCDVVRPVHYLSLDAVGGIVEFMAPSFLERWITEEHLRKDAAEVMCVPMSRILSTLGIQHIDYWSLDVEGGELAILKTFDFAAVSVSVASIECDTHDAVKDEEVVQHMLAHGFEFVGKVDFNCWFKHQDFVPSVASA